MAIRQYIGGRYVPKFMGTYDVTQTYEALCVVDNGMGTDYISKIPTPAGTPLTNTTYWALYGAYSGAIVNLQNQIDNINNVTIPAINSSISGLSDAIDDITNKKYVIVSDSYGNNFGNTITPFNDIFASVMGLTAYTDYFASHYDGAGFVSDGRYYDVALNNAHTEVLNHTTDDTITDVVILGGCNDALITSDTDMNNGMNRTITLAKTLFPNAKIYIGAIGGFNDSKRPMIMRNVVSRYLNCNKFGAYPLPNLQYVMCDADYFQADAIHPNQNGMDAIGYALANAFTGGHTEQKAKELTLVSYNTAIFSNVVINDGYVYADDGAATIMIQDMQCTISGSTLAAGNITIGSYDNDLIIGNLNDWIDASVLFYGDDGGTITLPVIFYQGSILMVNDKVRTITGFAINRIVHTVNRFLA